MSLKEQLQIKNISELKVEFYKKHAVLMPLSAFLPASHWYLPFLHVAAVCIKINACSAAYFLISCIETSAFWCHFYSKWCALS